MEFQERESEEARGKRDVTHVSLQLLGCMSTALGCPVVLYVTNKRVLARGNFLLVIHKVAQQARQNRSNNPEFLLPCGTPSSTGCVHGQSR